MSIENQKNWILSSGFPFENDILRIINSAAPYAKTKRNVEFETQNSEGTLIIRSIDFHVELSRHLHNIPEADWHHSKNEFASVNFVIECKYSQEKEAYLFIPSESTNAKNKKKWPHLVPALKKDRYGRETNIHRLDLIDFAIMPQNVHFAVTGRKVNEINKERDSVAAALLQVIQGTQYLVRQNISSLGQPSAEDEYFMTNSFFIFL